jgi:hypothetical protein
VECDLRLCELEVRFEGYGRGRGERDALLGEGYGKREAVEF